MTSDDDRQHEGPYKGLSSFTEADAEYFFGREEELDLVAANLRARRLSLLYGPSGVGKSSLLGAGVAPNLRDIARRRQEEFGSPRFVPLLFHDWSDDPLGLLKEGIAEAAAKFGAGAIDTSGGLVETLEAASMATDRASVLIILDQFEEYFLYHHYEEGPGTFASEFPRAVNTIGLPARFLLAMREDTLAQLDKFKNDIPDLFDSRRRVKPLNGAEAAEAIRRPLDEYNRQFPSTPFTIQDSLVDAVIHQVQTGKLRGEQTGAGTVGDTTTDSVEAPFLQLVMKRLWEAEVAEGSHRLRLATLKRLGDAETIVGTHLDATLDALSPEEQDLASDIFHQLVTPSGTKIVHSTHDLQGYTEHSEEEIISLLQRLQTGDTRIVRPVPPPSGTEGPARYEIFHDVLAQAILDWRGRHEKIVLQKEKEQAQHEVRRQKRLTLFAVVGGVVAIVLAIVAVLSYFNSRTESNANASRHLAAEAINNLNTDPELSTLLSLSAMSKSPTQEAQAALRQSYENVQETSSIDTGSPVLAAAMSEKGQIVAGVQGPASRLNERFEVWNSPTSRPIRLDTPYNIVGGVAFVNDGRQILITGDQQEKTVASLDVFDNNGSTKPSQIVNGPSNQDNSGGIGGVSAMAVDQTQNLVATVNNTGQLCVFSVAAKYQGSCTPTLPLTASGQQPGGTLRGKTFQDYEEMDSVSLDAQGDRAVTVAQNEIDDNLTNVTVWSIPPPSSTGVGVPTVLEQLDEVPGVTSDAALNPAGTQVATEGGVGEAQLWNISSPSPQMAAQFDTVGYSFDLTYSDDGTELLTTNDLGQSTVWNVDVKSVDMGTEEAQLNCHCGVVNSDAFAPQSDIKAITGSADGRIRIWRAVPRELLESISVTPAITGGPLIPVPNSNQIVGSGNDNDIVITNYETDQSAEVPGAAFAVEAGYANNDKENTLFVVDTAGGVVKYELSPDHVQPQTRTVVIKDGQQVDEIAISPNGEWAALAQRSGDVALIRLYGKGGALSLQYNPSNNNNIQVQSITFNRDGSRFLVSYFGNYAAIWNTRKVVGDGSSAQATYLGEYRVPQSVGFLLNASFSPNGRRVALVDSQGLCYVYATSAATIKAAAPQSWLARFSAGTGQLNAASLNSTGSQVATAGDDGVVRIWDVATGAQLSALGPEGLPNPTAMNAVLFGPNYVLSTSNDGILRFWSTDGTQTIAKVINAAKNRVTRGYTAQERQLYGVSG
jgi:WD40 repeat protein